MRGHSATSSRGRGFVPAVVLALTIVSPAAADVATPQITEPAAARPAARAPERQAVAAEVAAVRVDRDPVEAVKAVIEETRNSTRTLAQNYSGEFLKFVVRTAETLDSRGITTPVHRDAMMVPAVNTLAAALIAQFDAYASPIEAKWKSAAPALSPAIAAMLAEERDRLVEFLRADPAIIERIAKQDSPPAEIAGINLMDRVASVTAEADSGPGFTARLLRAQIVGDLEVERVVRRRVGRDAKEVGDKISDAYLAFILSASKALNAAYIFDTGVRRSILAPQSKAVADSMTADFDGYAVTAKKAFDGAGKLIPGVVAAAIKSERAGLIRFFATDIDALRAAVDAALENGDEPSGRAIRATLEMQRKLAVR